MTRRLVVLTGVVLAAAVLLSACGSGRTLEADGVVVLVGERASNGADALLSGTLEAVDGCLGIDGMVVVWPHGTGVGDEAPLSLRVPGRAEVGVGGEIEVGGGVAFERGEHAAEDTEVAGVMVPAACVAAGVWVGSE